MGEPTRCFECGSPISWKWDAFLILKEHLVASDDDSDKKFIDPDLNQNLMPAFEALAIEKYCCRQHFTTSRDINNF
jgi:DNA-directed RNA polymerase subunit N (RpoN/RPB10)